MPEPEPNHEIDPLTRIAIKYGTDKWGLHFYTPVYHQLFASLRDRPIRLLEIGVGGYGLKSLGGGSLAMWADYFPSGAITGIDIAEKRLDLGPRVKLYRGSQDDPPFLARVCDERGPFDIVIDDGSHVPKHVVASFHALFPVLADGGLYVIEDVQTAFWPKFGGSILHGGDTMKLARTVMECLNHAEIGVVDRTHSFPPYANKIKSFHAFHNLFVVERGDNSEPSNAAYDLNNSHVVRTISTIERELERSPTADGLANLAAVYLSGGNPLKAKEIAESALSLSPANMAALRAAYTVAARENDLAATIGYLERILRIEPDNGPMRDALKNAQLQLDK